MCSMWAYVGLAKVHCGATPPSVMVLFKELLLELRNPDLKSQNNVLQLKKIVALKVISNAIENQQ